MFEVFGFQLYYVAFLGMSKFAMDEIRRRQILRKNSKGAMKLQEELKQVGELSLGSTDTVRFL